MKSREIKAERTGQTSAQIRERVVAARRRQQVRIAGKRNMPCNARRFDQGEGIGWSEDEAEITKN